MAALASRLAEKGIAANPVSGFYHDHLFVAAGREFEAMAALEEVANEAAAASQETQERRTPWSSVTTIDDWIIKGPSSLSAVRIDYKPRKPRILRTMASYPRQQPLWRPPPQPSPDVHLPRLKIFNSLTRKKEPFVPLDPSGKKVTWYICGPTVYDDAHIGHARNYVSTDIIRRIMMDYFNFDVRFVMNITDVDDKIIIRGRQQYLLDEFNDAAQRRGTTSVEDTCLAALTAYLEKNLKLLPPKLAPEDISSQIQQHYGHVMEGKALRGGVPGDDEAKIKMHVKTALAAAEAVNCVSTTPDLIGEKNFNEKVQDVLLPYLDSLYGATIDASDHSIFTKLTTKFENRFMEDVRALNFLDPDVVTRVTEYDQKIKDFVEKIEQNGFAYKTSDGSVYFDIEAFEAASNSYARLKPESRHDTELQADGEGALANQSSSSRDISGPTLIPPNGENLSRTRITKRSDADFALWKASKSGEPSWPSPWGAGRPGWHIECSAMASDVLGSRIDIHSGGIDLAFPHHDNELAQSEAYWCDSQHKEQHQWVNYFLHMGHLSIAGAKMSKSLKNFKTIREELSQKDGWDSRGLRIIFLLGSWKEGIEITEDIKLAAYSWEDKVNNFFFLMKKMSDRQASSPTDNIDRSLEQALQKAKDDVDAALCDSFNTPSAMKAISDLISAYNSTDQQSVGMELRLGIARWITRIVTIFGLNGSAKADGNSIGWSGINLPDYATPYLTLISSIRDTLRLAGTSGHLELAKLEEVAKSDRKAISNEKAEAVPYQSLLSRVQEEVPRLSNSKDLSKDALALSDRIRNVELAKLGVKLEDQDDGRPAFIRPMTKAEQALKSLEKAGKEAAKARMAKAAEEKAKKDEIKPVDMFRTSEYSTQYSAWDEEGLPIKDFAGMEITQSKRKKLVKEQLQQKKRHEAWLKQKGLADAM
ncbi:MAG: hypothetical protein Q9200_006750 [Gallowayella weberi]